MAHEYPIDKYFEDPSQWIRTSDLKWVETADSLLVLHQKYVRIVGSPREVWKQILIETKS